jgi:hypothetical protein
MIQPHGKENVVMKNRWTSLAIVSFLIFPASLAGAQQKEPRKIELIVFGIDAGIVQARWRR